MILSARLSARMVCRFLTMSGSKLLWRSWGVVTSKVPTPVLSVLLPLPLRLFPLERSLSSRWASISTSKALSRKFFSNGAKAPSFPNRLLPVVNCSRAFFSMLSNSSCVIISPFEYEYKIIQTEFRLHPPENELNELVDVVYKDLHIESNDKYIEGLNKHLDIQFKYNFIKDLTTDEKVFTREGLDTISVIPDCFEPDLYNCTDRDILGNHELSISKRRANSVKIIPGPLGFKFIDANYDDKKGLTFKEKNENKTFVS